VRLLAAFEDYSDAELPYVFNRHVLQHEDNGMMLGRINRRQLRQATLR
jgi:FtsP/CotA-like multicopper oxidase with cupredoxin domain